MDRAVSALEPTGSRISLASPYLIGYWCQEFSCSAAALREAVAQVGNEAADVRRHLDAARRSVSPASANSIGRRASKLLPTNDPTNVIAGVVAVGLCLVNAVLWVFIASQAFMGVVWIAAGIACMKLQVWSQGIR